MSGVWERGDSEDLAAQGDSLDPLLGGEGFPEGVHYPGQAFEHRRVLAFREVSGDPSPDRVPIERHEARRHRPFIEQPLHLESPLPKPAGDLVFPVREPGERLRQKPHQPRKVREAQLFHPAEECGVKTKVYTIEWTHKNN